MRVYLANCCFNRPFDDQSQARVRLEAEAKLEVQQRIKDKKIELAWSYVLDYESQANPFEERRDVVARWKMAAVADVAETEAIIQQTHEIAGRGLRAKQLQIFLVFLREVLSPRVVCVGGWNRTTMVFF